MSAAFPLYLIPLFPLLGAAFALLLGKRLGKEIITLTSVGAVFLSLMVACRAVWLLAVALPPSGSLVDSFFNAPFIQAGTISINAGLALDRLSSVLLLVITSIGFLIHIYSSAYMDHDAGYTRFFGYLNLFTGAMLILVLGDSLLVTFVGWEGVGLCSYLLIGFWYDKEANANAGRKAFVVNRVGDFGFLTAIFLLLSVTGTVKYSEIGGMVNALHTTLWFGLPAAYYIGLFVLVGAAGKSAQIPLYVWLPDAMAGPTPVSALIHAATMVTAGIYVITRMHSLYEVAPATLAAVAAIGAITALFAATIAITQRDLKKVLAYSTVSQLGFMFAGVGSYLNGSSNYHAGIFHLVTHAFFKAGLFLGAGSVMHALSGEGDITRMGGLKRYLPHTRWTFLIYCLAIAGIFPFAGFWSKDAILAGVHAAAWPVGAGAKPIEIWFAAHTGHMLYLTLLAAAGCTAFYMFRLYFLVFEGEFRGTEEQRHHLHESPAAMTGVLWLLALGAILVGLLGIPDVVHEGADRFGHWLSPLLMAQLREESLHEFVVAAGIATLVSMLSITLAYVLYSHGFSKTVRRIASRMPRLYQLSLNKYYIDEIYDRLIVRPLHTLALVLWKLVDTVIIDGTVNAVGYLFAGIGRLFRYTQNGDTQRYLITLVLGLAATIWWASSFTAHRAAKFTVEHHGAEVEVTATLADPNNHRVRYRIDWEGGHQFGAEQSSIHFSHHYDAPGEKRITVQASDGRWGSVSTESQKVLVP